MQSRAIVDEHGRQFLRARACFYVFDIRKRSGGIVPILDLKEMFYRMPANIVGNVLTIRLHCMSTKFSHADPDACAIFLRSKITILYRLAHVIVAK